MPVQALSTSSRHGYRETMSWWGPLWAMSWWGLSMVGSSRHGYTTKGRVEGWIEPPVCPTYSRGPFIRSVQNIANRYCTECIIGIVQNAGTPSRLRFARTRRDEGGIEPPVPKGILILDASGQYAVMTFAGGRSNSTTEGTNAANFGTWSVNEADKTITRRFVGALSPANEGVAETKNSVSLAGDELKLVGQSSLPSGEVRVNSVYRRVK